MKEIFESFVVETKEILEKLDLDLVELEKKPDDADLLNSIFRSFHTIKGTSGFLGLNKLDQVTHKCEDILNKLRKNESVLNDDIINAILMAYDNMKGLLDSIETRKNEDVDIDITLDTLLKVIQVMESGGSKLVIKEPVPPEKKLKSSKKSSEKSTFERESRKRKTKSSKKIEQPINAVAEIHDVLTSDQSVCEEIINISEDLELSELADEILEPEKVEVKENLGKTLQKQTFLKTETQKDNTIRVDVGRLDDLLNIVSELVLGRNRLAQVNSEVSLEYEGTQTIS